MLVTGLLFIFLKLTIYEGDALALMVAILDLVED